MPKPHYTYKPGNLWKNWKEVILITYAAAAFTAGGWLVSDNIPNCPTREQEQVTAAVAINDEVMVLLSEIEAYQREYAGGSITPERAHALKHTTTRLQILSSQPEFSCTQYTEEQSWKTAELWYSVIDSWADKNEDAPVDSLVQNTAEMLRQVCVSPKVRHAPGT